MYEIALILAGMSAGAAMTFAYLYPTMIKTARIYRELDEKLWENFKKYTDNEMTVLIADPNKVVYLRPKNRDN